MKKADVTSVILRFPIHGSAASLFLEWVRNYQNEHPGRLTFSINTESCVDEVLNDRFIIKFDSITKELIKNCRDYINSNI